MADRKKKLFGNFEEITEGKVNEEVAWIEELEDKLAKSENPLGNPVEDVQRVLLEVIEGLPAHFEMEAFTIEGVPEVRRDGFSVELIYTDTSADSEEDLVKAFKDAAPFAKVNPLGGGQEAGFIGAELIIPVKEKTEYFLDVR